jgi:L-alanine-DL-glutamate epimerase-like enolase superfamily enzyme
VQITAIHEWSVAISRYADSSLPSGGLTTSIVAIETDVRQNGAPVVGFGFASFGRYAQSGLIRERFVPRLLDAPPASLLDDAGSNLDPFRAWDVMMSGEKAGGHGERCVSVGALDMAIWDAAAKRAGLPLYCFLAGRTGRCVSEHPGILAYAGGGYRYPANDLAALADEMSRLRALGYTHAKMKIGGAPLLTDLRRIEVAAGRLNGPGCLAVDAMNTYDPPDVAAAATALASLGLWWVEDICDPLDFETLAAIARSYPHPLAAGEALFSAQEATLLHRHGGLRPGTDVLVFDPVHCYGIPGYLRIVNALERGGWTSQAFWPHGGHLMSLHVAAALGLGGAEVNPGCFHPFGGLHDNAVVADGVVSPPDLPGIGFEGQAQAYRVFRSLLKE